ncbi:OmpH family outer membrane protein [Acetobacter sp.]|uniref:OmpH family outer membrane protein n=1 Tax=Acetobacter sp. TaxID=440 RepID=UPI0025C64907|nr:OmpH family outer membrane protein [Acetobacter sp.]MCH4092242.1 OmpH family outer membrane protein [Acetobacter sp.]MCI1299841.1 OmpH family outer membrane protein [Acetobacter sp.]MCI1315859.1 OmpH family outer membrane protein [Acetobacter sp.]
MIRFSRAAVLASSMLLVAGGMVSGDAFAQTAGGGGWFVPKAAHPVAPPPAHVPSHASRPMPQPAEDDGSGDEADNSSRPPPVLPQPAIPPAPGLPKAAPPPTSVIGMISVADVMRQSLAGQQVERELGGRRDELARDAQHAQAGWREEQQKLQSNAKSMTADQIQSQERALQSKVMRAQRQFRDRNRVIQEAAQVALGQIERELVQVIQQVAGSHGMNLVLHSEQVALHVDGQDITNEVAKQLNVVLPTVYIPAANEDPEVLAKSGKMPTTASPPPGPAPTVSQAASPAPAQAPAQK